MFFHLIRGCRPIEPIRNRRRVHNSDQEQRMRRVDQRMRRVDQRIQNGLIENKEDRFEWQYK